MKPSQPPVKTWLDRLLSPITDVRPGEGLTAILMLANIFLLLLCYAVIKTVREPLILLGGGAEVRSYAAAGQALFLIGFVPLYGWVASKVGRVRLLVGVTLFFIACIELFTAAVIMRMPFVGVAFFIWVGIFNVSLVAQFWSLANDVYSKEAAHRLFPLLVMGMTAGAPIGSLVAGRLFRLGLPPQIILQVSAVLLGISGLLYIVVNRRVTVGQAQEVEPMSSAASGFTLVLRSRYLTLIAALIVLLNVVNTTGEYIVSRLLTAHVAELAATTAAFNKTAFIGAYYADYQFWVNVTALLLQAFVASRLVKYAGMRGALLALPLIALGGYAIIAAGAGLSIVRWIKTAENATDYSLMNTARQLLWVPATREEKYKAKQAIDTFFVRGGDVLSAVVVYVGTAVLHLDVAAFATANIVLTLAWLGVAWLILSPPAMTMPRLPRLAHAAAVLIGIVAFTGSMGAVDLHLSTDDVERALKVGRSEQAARAAFHRPYVIAADTPAFSRLEVVTELRRLVLLAEDHVAAGDMLFTRGTREATEALRPWHGKVSILAGVKFDPRNTYLLAPPVELALIGRNGAVRPLELRSKSVFGFGAPGSRLPVVGAESEADFPAEVLAHSSATLIVTVEGRELARTSIDFMRLR